MLLRGVLRVPMGVFDEYRALCFKHPKFMNFYLLYVGTFFVLFLGKGVEKLTMRGEANTYEFKRRASRLFIPYWLVGYQWRFPENK